MELLGVTQNGNYTLKFLSDGTKIRYTEEDEFIPDRPESMDIKITNKCNMGCRYCFIPGTLVSCGNRSIPIENVCVGDVVNAFNEGTESETVETVLKTYHREYNGSIIRITLENGKIINCTPNHRLYTTNRGWVAACDLNEEDDIYVETN